MPIANPLMAPWGGAVAGVSTALLFALIPGAMLEDWVWASGAPALVAAAAPPLGLTARAVLALAGGAVAASIVWSLLYLLVGPGGLIAVRAPVDAVPAIRRADAHPDAPARRPMTAAEMGTPLMEVTLAAPLIEQPLPADLEQPLAAFDPGAIPEVPLTPPAPVMPLARSTTVAPLAQGERINTYVLTPPRSGVPPTSRREPGSGPPSIDVLLRRLEEVAAQRKTATTG